MQRSLAAYLVMVTLLSLSGSASSEPLTIDKSLARPLDQWKPQITQYSARHYGEPTWELKPTAIVLHYTAMPDFPWNLVKSEEFAGEPPGLASHYVVDGTKVWQLLPTNVRSRACYGMNHRAINIEMMALDAEDLAGKKATLETCIRLCRELMDKYGIPKSKIYSHEDVSKMDRALVPEVLDLVRGEPYHKIDPGVQNMKTILDGL